MSIAALRELASTENDDVLTEMLTAGLDRWTMYRLLKFLIPLSLLPSNPPRPYPPSYSSSLPPTIISYLLPLRFLNFHFSSCAGPLRAWFKPTRTNNQVASPLQYVFIFQLWLKRILSWYAVHSYVMSCYRELSSICSSKFVRKAVTIKLLCVLCRTHNAK